MQVIQQPSATTLAVQANVRWRHSTMLMATAAACMLAPTSAKADGYNWWQKQTTDQGCYAYVFDGSVSGMESDPQPEGFVWSGNCAPNAPINGEGIQYRQTKYTMSEGDVLRRIDTRSGRMVNGFWDGPIKNATYDVDESGKWSLDDPLPVPAEMVVVQYRMGCPVLSIGPASEYMCTPGKIVDPINLPKVSPPYYAVPGLAKPVAPPIGAVPTPTPFKPAPVAPPVAATGNFTILPPTLTAERKGVAFDTVATSLLGALDGNLAAIGTGSNMVDKIIQTLAGSLRSGQGAELIGSNTALIDVLMGEVRSALGTNLPSSANQLADLAMGELKRALIKPRAQPQLALSAAPATPAMASTTGSGTFSTSVDNVIAAFARANEPVIFVEAQSDGDVVLRHANNNQFTANLYYCTDATGCGAIQLAACYLGHKATIADTEKWNSSLLFGRAFIDNRNRLCIDMVQNTAGRQIDEATFKNIVSVFRGLLDIAAPYLI